MTKHREVSLVAVVFSGQIDLNLSDIDGPRKTFPAQSTLLKV